MLATVHFYTGFNDVSILLRRGSRKNPVSPDLFPSSPALDASCRNFGKSGIGPSVRLGAASCGSIDKRVGIKFAFIRLPIEEEDRNRHILNILYFVSDALCVLEQRLNDEFA